MARLGLIPVSFDADGGERPVTGETKVEKREAHTLKARWRKQ